MNASLPTPLTAHRLRDDLESAFRLLRDRGPVIPVDLPEGLRVWVVTHYEESRRALVDLRLVKDLRRLDDPAHGFAGNRYAEDWLAVEGRHMLNSDGEEHARLRTVAAHYLSSQAITRCEPQIEAIARRLAEDLTRHRQVDLMTAFAQPLPELVLARIMGIEDATMQVAARLTRALSHRENPSTPHMRRTYSDLVDIVRDLVRRPALDGEATLIAGLQAAVTEGELSRREMVSTVMALLAAGISSTTIGIAHGAATLMQAEATLRQMLDDTDNATALVEELLRHHPPFPFSTWRFAPEEVRIGGTVIPAGATVLILLASANRDPAAFEEPENLVPGRPHIPAHLVFGRGPHYCVGANLARAEIRIGLQTLFRHVPGMRLAQPYSRTAWRGLLLDRTIISLPVHTGKQSR